MKNKNFKKILYTIIALIILAASVVFREKFTSGKDISEEIEVTQSVKQDVKNYDCLAIHFIDVGQADCIYITDGNSSMLIDAGKNDTSDMVVNYLKEQGVNTLDYVIATHPHEDHIGGMDDVLNNFNVKKILMPNKVTTTKTFENLLLAMKNNGCEKVVPSVGQTYNLGSANFSILAPNSNNYDDNLNNYSIVIKLKYKNNSFLFMGDAESLSENEILNKGDDIKCDLLKVGHHGSSTSTSSKFLNEVKPKYAVISVGKNNQYNLPKKTVMNRLKKLGVIVYRTDEQGTIIATSDGNNITFNKNSGTYSYMK